VNVPLGILFVHVTYYCLVPYVIFYGTTGVLTLPSYFQLQKIIISHLFTLDDCNTLQ